MCTAIGFQSKDYYFGRNLDLEYSYQEKVTVTARNFPLYFRSCTPLLKHYGFIGMATLANRYPLYYDGVNEYGLCAAALNFPGNAVYVPANDKKFNIAHFELIPWILGSFQSTQDLLEQANNLCITGAQFSGDFPVSALHWIVSDGKDCIVIESTKGGVHFYDNPAHVLANNPVFPCQLDNLRDYLYLSNKEKDRNFPAGIPVDFDSRGTGSIGLPGDLTSKSRFVRAYFTKAFSSCRDSESASISQVFHILGSVTQTQGTVLAGNQYVKTVYTSCCNATKGIYYYKTYENSQITGICLHEHDLESDKLSQYPLRKGQQIKMEKVYEV